MDARSCALGQCSETTRNLCGWTRQHEWVATAVRLRKRRWRRCRSSVEVKPPRLLKSAFLIVYEPLPRTPRRKRGDEREQWVGSTWFADLLAWHAHCSHPSTIIATREEMGTSTSPLLLSRERQPILSRSHDETLIWELDSKRRLTRRRGLGEGGGSSQRFAPARISACAAQLLVAALRSSHLFPLVSGTLFSLSRS